LKKTVSGKHDGCRTLSGSPFKNFEEVRQVENDAFKDRAGEVGCRMQRCQAMPGSRQPGFPLRRAFPM
jgi:hypothetical protein